MGRIFITFEGGEGAGKTTQIQMLLEYLQQKGFDVVSLRDPGGTPISEKIRDIVKDKDNALLTTRAEALLYLAARNQMTETLIKPDLKAGKIVLCDRFSDSTLAYQGYGNNFMSIEELDKLSLFASSGLKPDLTFLLEIQPEIGLTRKKGQGELDRLEMKGLEYHKRVAEGFARVAEDNPDRIVRIDATLDAHEVHKEITNHVHNNLNI